MDKIRGNIDIIMGKYLSICSNPSADNGDGNAFMCMEIMI